MDPGSMIEVFKTSVEEKRDAELLIFLLLQQFPASRINFDLQDCDRILRVEGSDFCADNIISLIKENGFHCSILE